MGFFESLAKFTPAGQIAGLMGGQDPGKKQLSQILQQYRMLQGQQGNLYANALAMQQKGLGAVKAGYGKALNETSNLGAVAKQNVLDREKQNVGALASQMAGSGMTGGTLQANLQRGLYRDTNSSLSEIDSTVSQIRSGLMTQLAQAEAGQYGALSGLFQNQNAANIGLGSNLIQTLGSVQHTDPNAWLGNLMQMGAQVGTMAIMGSDRRLKTDIRLVGREHDINVYEFRYKSDPSTLWRGVMADEVEDVPGAVYWIGGHRYVDYSKIPVKMEKVV